MSYLVLLPCMLAVYLWAGKRDLSGGYLATVNLLLTVILSGTHWFVSGVDTLVATCLTMVLAHVAHWYIEREFTKAIEGGVVEPRAQSATMRFCSTTNHDFAIASSDFSTPVDLINSKCVDAVVAYFAALDAEHRQGLYASIDYSCLSADAVKAFVDAYPANIDANVLYGHVKICEAKQRGLVPGVLPVESAAAALAVAFKHFRIAQRLDPNDAESLCGLIITKGCVALKDEQIESSLKELLRVNALHIHGVLSAARFLIKSPEKANRFIEFVGRHSDEELTTAIAGLVAHIECGSVVSQPQISSTVIADMYRQLRIYRRGQHLLGGWQRAICNNVIAFAFERIGDQEEASRRLEELHGMSSPYPWRRPNWSSGTLATMTF